MKPTLLILAAGLGSRYGGFKQLDGIGPNGEIIMDYSINDALQAGFGKIVLIVQDHMIPLLAERYQFIRKKGISVEFAVQTKELDWNGVHYENAKPWGTAHAIWCAREKVKENFLLINADDFYGRNSFELAYQHLPKATNPCAIIYPILKTLSDNGTVNRAEVFVENGHMVSSIEREKISVDNGQISYIDEQGAAKPLKNDIYVSMNMFGFTTEIFNYIENDMTNYIEIWKGDNKTEYQLPNVVSEMIKKGLYSIDVMITDEEWLGITYKEDKELAMKKLNQLHVSGVYENLI